jgi:3'(2'), 5'-bisphosphate nucleotidase
MHPSPIMDCPLISSELQTVIDLVDKSSVVALEVYRRDFGVDYKSERDPVTEADRRVNELLCNGLQQLFPDDRIIGEESGFTGSIAAAGRAWFVDPVDGTKDFIKKNGEWSIMVGLVCDGLPVLGVVFQAATGDMYYAAAGQGCWIRTGTSLRQLRVEDVEDPSDAVVVGSRSHPDPHVASVMAAMGLSREYAHGSIGCKLAQIADRRAHAYFNFSGRCHMWDTAGPEAILREAGGVLCDVNGDSIRYYGDSTLVKQPFVATVPAIQKRLLPYFKGRPELQEKS